MRVRRLPTLPSCTTCKQRHNRAECPYPPLQKSQERGTHRCGGVREIKKYLGLKGWATRLTEEAYVEKIQPLLAKTTLSEIATAISVSIPYASDIRKGKRQPHPRHWSALARLVGVTILI